MRVYPQSYLLEHAGCYERTTWVEGPCPTNIQVSLVDVLQNSQEVSTFKLDRDREAVKDKKHIIVRELKQVSHQDIFEKKITLCVC